MTASLAPFAHPSYALTCWVDEVNIYIEIPSTAGNPYVQKFPLIESGLSKALHFLKLRYEIAPIAEKNYTREPEEPGYVCKSTGASVVYRKQKTKVQTDEQRAAALAVLRKLGVV